MVGTAIFSTEGALGWTNSLLKSEGVLCCVYGVCVSFNHILRVPPGDFLPEAAQGGAILAASVICSGNVPLHR